MKMKYLMSLPNIVVPGSCDGNDCRLYMAARLDTCEDESSFFLLSFILVIYIFFCVVLSRFSSSSHGFYSQNGSRLPGENLLSV
jgi:hypothetical protein